MHMKKQIFVRAAASAAVLILLSPLLAGAAAAVQPDVSRNGSGASADAAAGPVRAESPRLSAKSAVLLDAYTGRVLYASHAEDKSLIASTTKIMTALVICEAGDLDRTVVIPSIFARIHRPNLQMYSETAPTTVEFKNPKNDNRHHECFDHPYSIYSMRNQF